MNQTLQKLGVTPSKAAIVAVLGSVLALVWGPMLFGGSDEAAIEASKPVASRSVRRSQVAKSSGPAAVAEAEDSTSPDERAIPTISLTDASAFDPFRAPEWSPLAKQRMASSAAQQSASSPDGRQERFELLRSAGVEMIVVSSETQKATIGGRTVGVGDEIDGFQVIEITGGGVVLAPMPESVGGGDRGL